MKNITRKLAIVAVTVMSACSVLSAKQPNIIFILMDDMGYSDVSCYGAKTLKTPHIDALAKGGIKYENFYTAASICSPSRAAFLTGAYPQRCGLYMGINPNRPAHWFLGLSPDEITIAEQLKKVGYVTQLIGKWHLGDQEKFSYYKQGFDYYYGAPFNVDHNPIFYDEREVVYAKTPLDKINSLYAEKSVEFITENKDKPFFLFLSNQYPHTPYKPGEKFKGSSKSGDRGDVIVEADWGVGEIVKALKENQIYENTLIIFSSDNGSVPHEYSKPYSGGKFMTLEGGHRVPFILHWPEGIKQPYTNKDNIVAMDLFPTIAELASSPLVKDRKYDGVSLTPTFTQQAISRPNDHLFYYYNSDNLQAIRKGKWKLHLPRKAIQTPWWERNIAMKNLDAPLLFNIEDDKAEKKNLAAKHPEVVSELVKLAEQARQELGEYGQRGSEQRATGSLFPNVPIVTNMSDWNALPKSKKQEALSQFKPTKEKPSGSKKSKKNKK